jgi:CMP-N,N'-diacetyllegionaminic acid synthase
VIGEKRLLAIIPARGGSKRLPRKNILYLEGKPLIAWTIKAALKSKYIDRVVVSTDDDEIAEISKKYGADVPFIRPDELSTDEASSVDTIIYTLDKLKQQNDNYHYIVLLQPTSPLRTYKHINNAVKIMQGSKALSVISVAEATHNSIWCNQLGDNNDLSEFINLGYKNKRSQDLPKQYCLNGAIYLCEVSSFIKQHGFFLENRCCAFEMDKESSIDIDDKIDFQLAEVLINNIQNTGGD